MAPRSRLKAVDPKAAEPSKPKILIFGKAGVGKTWASLDFPNVYFIDTEGGANRRHYTDKLATANGSYLGLEQGSCDFETVIDQIKALATEQHHYKTVVIDSFTKLYNAFAADIAEKVGDDFGKDKKEANKPTRRLISWLGRLDMNVVLIAHEKSKWGVDAKGNRSEIGVTFDAYEKLDYELDLCLNVVKNGPQRLARVTKSRLIGFKDADAFPWSYLDFANLYGKDVIEKESKQITLATAEQVSELNKLLSIVKLPDGQEDKWLKAAGAEVWEDVDTDKIAKCIEALKERIPA